MGWIKNAALSLALLATAATTTAQERISKQLPVVMRYEVQQQEAHFGITHPRIPEIQGHFPARIDSTRKYVWAAFYDEPSDSIYVSSEYLQQLEAWQDTALAWKRAGLRTHDVPKKLRGTLWHELGHRYADATAQRIGIGDWPDIKNRVPSTHEWDPLFIHYALNDRRAALKIIGEGIGTYFEGPHRTIRAKRIDWSNASVHSSKARYSGGLDIVKPILDQYGQQGLEYLIRNPPLSARNLEEYQAKAIRDLYKQTGKLRTPFGQR